MRRRTGRRILALAAGVVFVVGAFWARDVLKYASRGEDNPPEIEFRWIPLGRVDLRDVQGTVTLRDDHALDFTTYRFRVVELDRTLDLPIEGMIGKEYTLPVSFLIFANEPRLMQKKEMTVEISVADDVGQVATVTKTVKLK